MSNHQFPYKKADLEENGEVDRGKKGPKGLKVLAKNTSIFDRRIVNFDIEKWTCKRMWKWTEAKIGQETPKGSNVPAKIRHNKIVSFYI